MVGYRDIVFKTRIFRHYMFKNFICVNFIWLYCRWHDSILTPCPQSCKHQRGPEQITPASSLCVQSWIPQPLCPQSNKLLSFPRHSTESNKIGSDPSPKYAFGTGWPPVIPSVRHITTASGPCLNIKTVLSTYGDFHVKDKTAARTSYL